METSFNGRSVKLKKPKRASKWTREVDVRDYDTIHLAHNQGILPRIIGNFMTLETEKIIEVLEFKTFADYTKRPSARPVKEKEPDPDPIKSIEIPTRKKKVITDHGLKKYVQIV